MALNFENYITAIFRKLHFGSKTGFSYQPNNYRSPYCTLGRTRNNTVDKPRGATHTMRPVRQQEAVRDAARYMSVNHMVDHVTLGRRHRYAAEACEQSAVGILVSDRQKCDEREQHWQQRHRADHA